MKTAVCLLLAACTAGLGATELPSLRVQGTATQLVPSNFCSCID